MGADSGVPQEREKMLNLVKWIALAGDVFVAVLLVVLLNDLGTLIYAIAAVLVVLGLFSFFVLFPWFIKLGSSKSK